MSSIDELRARKRLLASGIVASPKNKVERRPSAEDRTLTIADGVLDEQPNNARPYVRLDGPKLRRMGVPFEGTHLVDARGKAAICGAGTGDTDEPLGKVCERCRIEASRIRATVR